MADQPTGYRSILNLAHRCRHAAVLGDIEDAKRISNLISQLEERFPEAKKKLDEDYPEARDAE